MLEKNENMIKNKLNILFFLKEAKEPMEEINIERAMIETGIMDYFLVMQYLIELESVSFIKKQVIFGRNYYFIEQKGLDTLEFFSRKMLGSEAKTIKQFLDNNIEKIKKYKNIISDFSKIENGKFRVNIKILDDNECFFSTEFFVPTKEIAEKITSDWKENYIFKYSQFIENILI